MPINFQNCIVFMVITTTSNVKDCSPQNQKIPTLKKIPLNMDGDHCSTGNTMPRKKRLIYEKDKNLDSDDEPDYGARLLALKKRVLVI